MQLITDILVVLAYLFMSKQVNANDEKTIRNVLEKVGATLSMSPWTFEKPILKVEKIDNEDQLKCAPAEGSTHVIHPAFDGLWKKNTKGLNHDDGLIKGVCQKVEGEYKASDQQEKVPTKLRNQYITCCQYVAHTEAEAVMEKKEE